VKRPAVRHFLSVADLSPAEARTVLRRADEFKHRPYDSRAFERRNVGVMFEKPSLRTRVSFEVGIADMGGKAIVLHQAEIGIGGREASRDVARVMSRLLDLLVIRFGDDTVLAELARTGSIPIVNALSDAEHPCQALADFQTLAACRGARGLPLEGAVLAYVGDGNNVCHSLLRAGALLGVEVRVASPPGYAPDPDVVAWASETARGPGDTVQVGEDPAAAVAGADAVYTDAWASMGQETEEAQRRLDFAGYQVDAALMAKAGAHAVFLHCLPAHRNEEVTDEVIDSSRSRVYEQAENRLHSQKALLEFLIHESPGSYAEQLPR